MFNVLSDILFFKRGDQFQTMESEAEISPYMINRWISMSTPQNAVVINSTANVYWRVLTNKHDWYKFCLCILPKNKFSKTEYIKKAVKDKKADDNSLIYKSLAQNLEISTREVKSYIEEFNIDITHLKNILKNTK
jgi:hypothetical protein